MQKDVIYIDVDDDVTAIIGKIKKSSEKIVAIVPPKRAGALQSAVNLRLLDRMAKTSKKHLVLITNNPALVALAANASIPVAKNLQSKPEIAEIAAIAVDDGDDIIDGADLPVGDHASTVKVKDGTKKLSEESRSEALDTMDIDGEEVEAAVTGIATAEVASNAASKKAASKIKIPNFDKFRKRLFLGIGGGVLLVALLVWMFAFAPAATVIVTAKTSPAPVSATVKLGGTAATDFKTGVVKSVVQTEKKDETVEFDATGTGKVGEKAAGSVTLRNCDSSSPVTIPAGTILTTNGLNYSLQAAVTVGPAIFGGGVCTTPGTSSAVGIIAAEVGAQYNQSANAAFSVSGYSAQMRANATSAGITGGSSRDVKIVSADDIERAKGQLIGKSTDEQKKVLAKKFVNGEKVIDSSFTIDRAEAVAAPAVNAEAPATGKAKLTIATTYTMYAVPKADMESYLNESLKTQLNNESSQKIYNTGVDKATLSNFKKEGEVITATIASSGQIGPKIEEAAVKEIVKGKIYGEVQSTLEAINGVQDVDVQFSYFWVRTVPNDTNKIHIEFKLQDEN